VSDAIHSVRPNLLGCPVNSILSTEYYILPSPSQISTWYGRRCLQCSHLEISWSTRSSLQVDHRRSRPDLNSHDKIPSPWFAGAPFENSATFSTAVKHLALVQVEYDQQCQRYTKETVQAPPMNLCIRFGVGDLNKEGPLRKISKTEGPKVPDFLRVGWSFWIMKSVAVSHPQFLTVAVYLSFVPVLQKHASTPCSFYFALFNNLS